MYICIVFSRREGESNALRNELRRVRLENNGEFLQRQKSIFALFLKETRRSFIYIFISKFLFRS